MKYTLALQEDDKGELFIEFPPEMLESVGWSEGTTVEWVDNSDGSWTLRKKNESGR